MTKTNSTIEDEVPLLPGQTPEKEHGTNSWISTAVMICCTLAGVGTLGVPAALEASGWSGVILLFICAFFNAYTGVILGNAMKTMTQKFENYSDVGQHACGRIGKIVTQFSVYVTLVGVSIVFLILIGLLMNGIVAKVPTGFWIFVIGIGVLAPVAIALPSYSEISILSYLGFIATAIVVVVSIALSFTFYSSSGYEAAKQQNGFTHAVLNLSTFPTAFSVFTFAFGATAVFPNTFVKMTNKDDWSKAVCVGFSGSVILYLSISVVGYFVYGSYLAQASTILAAIQEFDPSTKVISQICSAIMVIHIISAFPIVVNPIFQLFEPAISPRFSVRKIVVRTIIMAVLVVVGLFFPYFLDVMSIVSCISVSLSGYVLPCVFYWATCKTNPVEKLLMIIIALFGLLGSGVGLWLGFSGMIADIKRNPNPFSDLFKFG